jgi:2-aminoethylphosphonate-pyruvate transaminase
MAISGWKDNALYTPGPLTTSRTVKQAMLRDLGSRDSDFLLITQTIRKRLLTLAGVGEDFTAVLMQGSGSFGVESVLGTAIPRNGKLLVLTNGAYGIRMGQMAQVFQMNHQVLSYAEDQKPDLKEIRALLEKDGNFTHIAVPHCETTSGILNPIREIGKLAKEFSKVYIVDAMSSLGGVPIDFNDCAIDYLISSSNKCIEGVPGFSFVIARRALLEKTEGNARSLSLDLYAQWKSFENAGEFRFTPPIQTILAFEQALNELDEEGGVPARYARYQENHMTLLQGMVALGFKPYLSSENQGPIITSFHYLDQSNFSYKTFYEKLQLRGCVIYSGKVSNAACFRIGNIGRLFKSDILNLVSAVRETLVEMQIAVPSTR